MRKIVAGINVSIDGFCDHTGMIADEELHDHYTNLLRNAGTMLYGRITYQLMESYWPNVIKNPTGDKSTDDFAAAIQDIPKVVFSRTMKAIDPAAGWTNARLAKGDLKQEVLKLREQPGKDILVGCRSLIVELANLNLIDEYQLCIHPVILGRGLPLFDKIQERTVLKLLKTKTFLSGTILCYYEQLRS